MIYCSNSAPPQDALNFPTNYNRWLTPVDNPSKPYNFDTSTPGINAQVNTVASDEGLTVKILLTDK